MRKIYDITLGHYVPVYEDDNNAATTDAAQDTDAQKEESKDTNKSTEENADIRKLNADLDSENKNYAQQKQSIQNTFNTNIQTARDVLTAATDAASRTEASSSYDKVQTNRDVLSAKKKILDLELKYAQDINRIELNHAMKVNAIENTRLQILSKMNNEKFSGLPAKYRSLNESNINQAKLYMNTLISEDDETPIRGMVDFKRCFQDTDIVYGKDKTGFYMLCLDRDDFNKIMSALQSAGYMRDELLGTLMPQILNRTAMLTGE